MFTGIVARRGSIVAIDEGKGRRSFRIHTTLDLSDTPIGGSIACDGCCLTVIAKDKEHFAVDAMNETLSVTTLSEWKVGSEINLEKSLKIGDELGGHIVTGHIDAIATVEKVAPDGDSWYYTISVPDEFAQYIVRKGSVALNGISLTVNEVDGNRFGICVIPHTWGLTNISQWHPGTKVNFEADMLARYVARILAARA